MATEHTATPWRVGDRNETRGVPILAGTDAETVRITAVYGSDALPDLQDEVNADFIVTAVNAHDDLVAAVRELLATYPITKDFEPCCAGELRMSNAVTDALTALALAGKVGE